VSSAQYKYVLSVDATGKCALVSRALLTRTGYALSDIPTYREMLELLFGLTPEQIARAEAPWADALAQGERKTGEHRARLHCRDGIALDTQWTIETCQDASGASTGMLAIGEVVEAEAEGQVSDRVLAYRIGQLEAGDAQFRGRASQVQASVLDQYGQPLVEGQKFEALAERAMEGVLVVDAEDRVVFANDAARDMLGLADAAIEGQSLAAPGAPLNETQREALQAIGQRQPEPEASADEAAPSGPQETQVTLQQPKRLRLSVAACPLTDGEAAAGWLYVLKDEAWEQDADVVKSDAVRVVSHDLRTPLTTIVGFTALLANGHMGKISPRQAEVLARIQRQSGRLLSLINDMLDVARIDRGELPLKRAPVALPALVAEQIHEAEIEGVQKQIQLRLDLPPRLAQVHGDPRYLGRVLAILIGDAIGFSPRGETVTVVAQPQGGYVLLAVSDNGPGLSRSATDHVFDKFSQVSLHGKKTRGSGLGLYLAANIVRLHGGRIWVDETRPGKGATFRFTLPVSPSSDEADPRGEGGSEQGTPEPA